MTMPTKMASLDIPAAVARSSLTPADKAVLAMTSTEYLALANPDDAEGALSAICSPVSATSTFSSIWSSPSRRPSSASNTSQNTDHSDGCVEPKDKDGSLQVTLTADPVGQDVALEAPEALAVGACVIRKDPATSIPGVVLVRHAGTEHGGESLADANLYHHHSISGLWRLPQSTTTSDDLSISEALARTVRQQTGLVVARVAATLSDTRHHLHHPQDVQPLYLRTPEQKVKPVRVHGAKHDDHSPPAGLGIDTLDELMQMIDLSCAGAAASFAAAAAARRNRNISASVIADCCRICDFTSSGSASQPDSATRRYSKHLLFRRNRRNSNYGDDISDSCSTGSSSGYASNSDESTCYLLHGEEHKETTTEQGDDFNSASDDSGEAEWKQRVANMRSLSLTNEHTNHYSSISYVSLSQDTETDESSCQDTAATFDSDAESSGSSADHEEYLPNDKHDDFFIIAPGLPKTFRECLQLNYVVLVSESPKQPALSNAANNNLASDIDTDTAIVTELDIDQWRMSPETRDLVRQGLRWAKEYFSPSANMKVSKPYRADKNDVEGQAQDADMPAPLSMSRRTSATMPSSS